MIDTCQWRASIGLWYCHHIPYTTKKTPSTTDTPGWIKSLLTSGDEGGGGTLIFSLVLFLLLLLILSGDIELNPGPKTELTSNNALRLLAKSGFIIEEKWTKLISLLGVSLEERRRLKTMASSDQDYYFALEEGLQWWIINGTAPSWEELISAVESCGDKDVATTLRRQLDIKDEGEIERQTEGTSDQDRRPSCGNSIDLSSNKESTNATENDEVHKVLKSVLSSHFADLHNQLSRCLPQVSATMYSKGLISKSVRDSPTVYNVIGEFETGMNLVNSISKLQEHCQLFLQCLSSEGGPTKLAAQKLCQEWVDKVKKQCDISLDLTCDDLTQQDTKQQGINNQEVTVTPDYPVAEELESLQKEYTNLVKNIKNVLRKLIDNGTLELIDISDYLGEYYRIEGLTDATDIPRLFQQLWPYYSYLDVEVLEVIVNNEDFLINERIKKDMCTYKQHLKEFKQSTTLEKFKNAVTEALIPNPEVTSITCEVVIKLNREWGKKDIREL